MRKTKQRKSKLPTVYAISGNRYKWTKDVYKEWYEYCKIADKLPKAFKAKTFSDWFKPELFAEPWREEDVKVVSVKNNILTLRINLDLDLHRIGINFLKVINKYKKDIDKRSFAKYQPSANMKDIKLSSLHQPRKVYALKQKGLGNLEIAYKMGFINKAAYTYKANKDTQNKNASLYESQIQAATRRIQRDVRQCKTILAHIAKGTFP